MVMQCHTYIPTVRAHIIRFAGEHENMYKYSKYRYVLHTQLLLFDYSNEYNYI